jgi:hypothetical protein
LALLIFLSAAMLTSRARAQSTAKLQSLVNDTVAQFQLAYHHNTAEQRRRYDQLSQTVAAWREAARNDANNRLLEDWLRGAIRSSMPGSQAALPPLPRFVQVHVESATVESRPVPAATPLPAAAGESTEQPPTTETQEVASQTEETVDKTTGDPFLDDPESTE